jgi:hypothetical protein
MVVAFKSQVSGNFHGDDGHPMRYHAEPSDWMVQRSHCVVMVGLAAPSTVAPMVTALPQAGEDEGGFSWCYAGRCWMSRKRAVRVAPAAPP